MTNTINKSIKDCLRSLAEFHTNTFDIDIDPKEKDDIKVGITIENHLQDYYMGKKEDACYIAGKIDAYKEVLRYIENLEEIDVPLSENDIKEVKKEPVLKWNLDWIDEELIESLEQLMGDN
jgi:hypothetical protein